MRARARVAARAAVRAAVRVGPRVSRHAREPEPWSASHDPHTLVLAIARHSVVAYGSTKLDSDSGKAVRGGASGLRRPGKWVNLSG